MRCALAAVQGEARTCEWRTLEIMASVLSTMTGRSSSVSSLSSLSSCPSRLSSAPLMPSSSLFPPFIFAMKDGI